MPSTTRPPLPWIEPDQALPSPANAWDQSTPAPGLLCAGDDLSTTRLREAYSKGIFPWFNENQPVLWWSTDPRMVLMVDQFRIHHSFKKTLSSFIKNPNCEIRIDSDFSSVIQNCAQRPAKRLQASSSSSSTSTSSNLEANKSALTQSASAGTWILPQMKTTYCQAHAEGLAHSVETWVDGELVGGLYCVSLGKAVFGESMFSLQKDASKIALAALVAFCRANGVVMIDCQQNTAHLASLGAKEITRTQFIESINRSQTLPTPPWKFQEDFWKNLFA